MGHFSPNIMANSFACCAEYNADHEVIIYGDRRITWKELTPRIFRIARALVKIGIKKNDKVAFMFHNTPEFIEVNMAIQTAGAIPVPVNYRFTSNEVEYQISHSDSAVLIYDSIWENTVMQAADKIPGIRHFICSGKSGFSRSIDYEEFASSAEAKDPKVPTGWDDVAVMIYTGGTTGFPKGVMLSYGAHREMFAILGACFVVRFLSQEMTGERKQFLLNAFSIPGSKIISIFQGTGSFKKIINRPEIYNYFRKTFYKRFTNPLQARKAYRDATRAMFPSTPFFHDASYSQLMMGAFLGNYSYVLVDSVSFDPELILQTIEKERVMNITNVPTGWKKLVSCPDARKYDLSSVRLATTGGGLCAASLKKEILRLLPNAMLMDSLGQTEMTPVTSFKIDLYEDTVKERSVGKSIVETRIVDENGREVASGEIGEIHYNSSTVMKGYYKEDDINSNILKDGWFRSGDLGYMDESGEIRIVDRKNECINTGGEKVFPIEVEEIINKHPQVEDACVIGAPDEEWGSIVRAVVAPKKGEIPSVDDIIAFCRGKMAGYKIPRSIIFTESLPYSSAGKLLRKKVRDLYGSNYNKSNTNNREKAMNRNLYKELGEVIMKRAGSMPVINCPEFEALITELFRPEQAAVAIKFPMGLNTAQEIAASVCRPVEEVEGVLESMARDGFIFTSRNNGETLYRLMEVLPGFFEFQFMKGSTTARDKRIAKLFDDYFDRLAEIMKHIPEPFKKVTPFSRVIPIDKVLSADSVIHPYETVAEYINKTDYISVSPCYCRHHKELTGDPCKHPKETCMTFGPNARHVVAYGFGRRISKEEAIILLDDIEKAGLIHISSNTSKYIDFLCNCCPCHCGVIKSFKDTNIPSMSVVSNFDLVIDEKSCTACGDCLERCPVEALSLRNGPVTVDRIRCIGCGVCNITCESRALSMRRRNNAVEPPLDRKELNDRIMKRLQEAVIEVKACGAG